MESASNAPLEIDAPAVSDSELVRRAKQGALDAFEALAARYERMVYSLARRMLQQEQDAQDVTQQTFISAVEHLAAFREESSFVTWIMRIATHAALKILRKRRTLEMTSLEQTSEPDEDYSGISRPEYIADWRQSPDEMVRRREIQDLIEHALSELDEKHRLVFLLRDVEGMSVKETAETLGITEVNVKVRLLRARLQLREKLTLAFGDPVTQVSRSHHAKNVSAEKSGFQG
jgi:RNA polymerase sigma-70 factor, ECF subfamily